MSKVNYLHFLPVVLFCLVLQLLYIWWIWRNKPTQETKNLLLKLALFPLIISLTVWFVLSLIYGFSRMISPWNLLTFVMGALSCGLLLFSLAFPQLKASKRDESNFGSTMLFFGHVAFIFGCWYPVDFMSSNGVTDYLHFQIGLAFLAGGYVLRIFSSFFPIVKRKNY